MMHTAAGIFGFAPSFAPPPHSTAGDLLMHDVIVAPARVVSRATKSSLSFLLRVLVFILLLDFATTSDTFVPSRLDPIPCPFSPIEASWWFDLLAWRPGRPSLAHGSSRQNFRTVLVFHRKSGVDGQYLDVDVFEQSSQVLDKVGVGLGKARRLDGSIVERAVHDE